MNEMGTTGRSRGMKRMLDEKLAMMAIASYRSIRSFEVRRAEVDERPDSSDPTRVGSTSDSSLYLTLMLCSVYIHPAILSRDSTSSNPSIPLLPPLTRLRSTSAQHNPVLSPCKSPCTCITAGYRGRSLGHDAEETLVRPFPLIQVCSTLLQAAHPPEQELSYS